MIDLSQLRLLHQDDWLLVWNKPSGLLAVPGRGPALTDCLSARAQVLFPEALVVHRLDRDTSGVLLMARDPRSQAILGKQFESRQVAKEYLAIVDGCVAEDEGTIDLPLAKDFAHPPRHAVNWEHGKAARTTYRVLTREAQRTRLLLQPLTGRSHQLRVHLAAIGHAVLGDPLYAATEAQAAAPRLLLHAWRLTIDHPSTGERITFAAECPF